MLTLQQLLELLDPTQRYKIIVTETFVSPFSVDQKDVYTIEPHDSILPVYRDGKVLKISTNQDESGSYLEIRIH